MGMVVLSRMTLVYLPTSRHDHHHLQRHERLALPFFKLAQLTLVSRSITW